MFSLKNKTALITGGGSGIGKAIALLFAKQGAIVHIIELNADAAKDTDDEINIAGDKAFIHSCDVTKHDDVVRTFATIGKLDILVNNAGIAHVGNVLTTAENDFDKVINVNVKGVYNCLHAAISEMKKMVLVLLLTCVPLPHLLVCETALHILQVTTVR